MIPEPEFLEAPERQLVALSGDFTLDTRDQLPGLWQAFWSREWDLPGEQEPACYGVSYAMHPDGRFSYAAGLSFDPVPGVLPDGACIVTLSAGAYAVFRNRGPLAGIAALCDAIARDWWPTSGETQRPGPVFERYPFEDGASIDDAAYELWFPVAR